MRRHVWRQGAEPAHVQKPQLPQLQPHINRKAQDLINKHYGQRKAVEASPSLVSMPLLASVEKSAPRAAPAHDVSHLLDKAKSLAPDIPCSLIPPEDHVYTPSFLPVDKSSKYSDGLWHTCVFPSSTPSSRLDAIQLDAWVTRRMEEYSSTSTGELADAVSDLVPILSVAIHEIRRQVLHQCAERGKALEKLWSTYESLFARVLETMKTTLETHRKARQEVQQALDSVKDELQELNSSHTKNIQQVIGDLEANYRSRTAEVDRQTAFYEKENDSLKHDYRRRTREADLWFPNFRMYQDSYIKAHIPQSLRLSVARNAGDATEGEMRPQISIRSDKAEEELRGPEVAIAEDFKRLLVVLSPEKRRLVGRELIGSFGTTYSQQDVSSPRAKAARQPSKVAAAKLSDKTQLEQLQAEVAAQERHMQNLREEIIELERLRQEEEDGPMQAAASVLSSPVQSMQRAPKPGDAKRP